MRMVVIPEEVYTSLLDQKKSLANPLDSHIIEGTNRLNEILHDPSTSDSTKFQLYMDKLKRLQNVRSNRDEMSTNVNLKSVTPQAIADLSGAIAQKLTNDEQLLTPKSGHRRPKKSASSELTSSDDSKEYLTESSENTYESYGTPKAPEKSSPRVIRKENFEKLRNYLDKNRQKFGIREDGKIFKGSSGKEVYIHSHFEKAAKSLTGVTPTRAIGLRNLYNKIKSDDYAKKLLAINYSTPQKGDGRAYNFSASKTLAQKRCHSYKCPPESKKIVKKARYCPEIWKRS